jgi:2-dehydro-3-deoxygalactonokinase
MLIAVLYSGDDFKVWIRDGASSREVSVECAAGTSAQEMLASAIAPYLSDGAVTPVICAGVETNVFAHVPCRVPSPQRTSCDDPRIELYALPCLSQANPADALQGEEAAIAGFIATYPDWDGILCLPGACTRWVQISAGEVVSFRSYLTGNLYELLAQDFNLTSVAIGLDAAVFDAAVSDALSRPERMASVLAEIQASRRLQLVKAPAALSRLSGTLIGIELAAARPYWLGQNVALIGATPLRDLYASALGSQGVTIPVHDIGPLTVAGLQAAYDGLSAQE